MDHEGQLARVSADRALHRAKRALRVLAAMHEALDGATDERDLCARVATCAVEVGGYAVAWVGRAEHDERRSVTPMAVVGVERSWIDGLGIVWADDERGQLPSGVAIRTGRPMAVPWREQEPRLSQYAEECDRRGWKAMVALPLVAGSKALGVLVIYSSDEGAFDEEETGLLMALARGLARAWSAREADAGRCLAEQRLQEIADTMRDAFWSRDARTRTTDFISPGAAALWGRPVEQFVGRPPAAFLEVVHPEDRERMRAAMERYVAGEPLDIEYRTVWPSGEVRWIHNRGFPVRDAGGEVVRVVGIASDVTEQRRMAADLRRLNAELERRVAERTAELADLYDNAPCGYQTLGHDGVYRSINATALRWLGYAREELVGKVRPFDLMPDEEKALAEQNFAQLKSTGQAHRDIEGTLRRKDGSCLPVLLSVAAIRDAEGNFVESRATLLDDTERRRAQQELKRLNAELSRTSRAKDEFLASMSHELRTPLNAVLGLGEILLEEIAGPLTAQQRSYLHRIDEAGRHQLALINDVLDLAKIEAGKLSLDLCAVRLEDVCRASLRMVQEAAICKSIRLTSREGHCGARLLVDERRLKQILVNLLSNAVKFTPEGGDVGIETACDEGGSMRVTVWDSGIGIDRVDQARLFQPFEQVGSASPAHRAGTGLGLSLVRQLVQLHGGEIRVESAPGRGSRFTVLLPGACTSPPPPGPARDGSLPPRHAPAAAPRGRVVVADDEENNVTVACDYLLARGFEVHAARDGSEALGIVRTLRPDLVLMDVHMPGVDGLTATRALRSDPDPALRRLPIIALTASAMPGDRERCLAAGANAYLTKPVALKALLAMIEQLLGAGVDHGTAGRPPPG
jgi:PAS domain S-box-containing protein